MNAKRRVYLTIMGVFLVIGVVLLFWKTPETQPQPQPQIVAAVEAAKQPTLPQLAEAVVPETKIVGAEEVAPKTNAVVILTGRITAE